MNKLKVRILQIKEIIKYMVSYILSKLLPQYKNAWLVCERGTDARDNGFAFYRYLCDKTDEKNVYYLISKDSVDLRKMQYHDLFVYYGSLAHYILLFSSKVIASAHADSYFPHLDYMFGFKETLLKLMKSKIVFLQHGIIKNFHSCFCYPEFKVDLFIAGAKPEYDYLCSKFNQPEGVMLYSGLARYDNLHNIETKNEILLMPTWRAYLSGVSDEVFLQSDYYKQYQSLITNEKLIFMLHENDLKLVFYIHEELQKYLHLFKSDCDQIVLANSEQFDVQPLLKESKILITDYSSVYFDFGYMNKPIVFYQFDRKDFLENHYQKGYFDYDTMGFGPICLDEDTTIENIEKYIENNFIRENEYNERADKFFTFDDCNNCMRIYDQIQKII